MAENIWKYGQYDLDKNQLFTYMQKNVDPFLEYYGYNPQQKQQFVNSLSTIKGAIANDTLQSKDGFGDFVHDPGIIGNDEITKNALYFLHKIATGYGSRLPEKKTPAATTVEETPPVDPPKDDLVGFDYEKHGLATAFNKQNNPFGNDSTYNLWKSGFADQQSLDTALADFIKEHREKVLASKYDYTKSSIDQDRYSALLTDLETDLRNGIQDSDKHKLSFLGLNPNSFILNPETPPIVTPPTGTPENGEETPEDEKKSKYGDLPFSEYISMFDEYGLEESDKLRLAGMALDFLSIIDPEPFTAAGMGYASDTLNLYADELDGINDSWWDDVLNYGLSTLGAIPLLGDLGMSGKFIKNLIKSSKGLLTVAGTASMGVAAADIGLNHGEMMQSLADLADGKITVDNIRNAFTAVQLIMGLKNASKTGGAKKKAKELDAKAEDVMTVKVKDASGKTKEASFGGQDKTDLEALKNNPAEFQKYIQEHFKDLGDAKLADVTTNKAGSYDWSNRKFKLFPTKRTADESIVNYTTGKSQKKGDVPSRWDRTRYFMKNKKETPFAERTKPREEPKVENTKATETPKEEEKTPRSKKRARKVAEEREKKKNKKQNQKNNSKKATKSESETKLETSSESNEINIPPGRSDERSATPASEIKPDTKSEAQKINEASRREKLRKFFKRAVEKTKTTGKEVAVGFNNLLNAIVEEMEHGGVLKAQTGTKIYGTNYTYAPDNYLSLYLNGIKAAKGTLGDNSNRPGSGVVYKNSATQADLDDLETYTSKFLPYTSDEVGQKARRQDLYNIFTEQLNKGQSLEDILGVYNNTVSSLYNYKRNEGLLIGENNNPEATRAFNNAHKSIYRSANSANGIYGYDDNLEHINGTTTLQRGPDRTQEEVLMDFSDLAEDDVLRKALGNHKLYKTKSGHYYLLNAEVPVNTSTTQSAAAQPAVQPVAQPAATQSEAAQPVEGQTPAGQAVAQGNKVTTSGTPPPSLEGPKPVAPNRPVQPFFTTDKALQVYNYNRFLAHNKKDLELSKKVKPMIYDILQYDPAPVRGKLEAEAEGISELGKAGQRAAQQYGSDQNFNAAVSRQYYNDALEFKNKKFAESSEHARQIEAENRKINATNKENRYNIAMKNLENVHQNNLGKLQDLADFRKANLDSGTNIINQASEWIYDWSKEIKEKQDSAYARKLANYIYNTPENYIPGFEHFKKIWNKAQSGEDLTASEQRVMSKIREQLITAYEIEKNGGTYSGHGIQRPEFQFIYSKQGGKLWHADKESLMDMYNRVKQQRRK